MALITSAEAGEGKTTVAAMLGISLALVGQRVVLIDGDLQRPSLHKLLSGPGDRGLAELLTEEEVKVKSYV